MFELVDRAAWLDPGIGRGELPIDTLLAVIAPGLPRLGFLTQGVDIRETAVQTLAGEDAEVHLSKVQPTAVLGGLVNLQPLRQAPGGFRREGFIKRTRLMGVEIVADQTHPGRLRILDLQQGLDFSGPVNGGAPLADMHRAATLERVREQEETRRPIALVFIVNPLGAARDRRLGRPRLLDELDGLFIHTDQRDLRIIRQTVGVEQVLHPGHELAVLLGRNHLGLASMRFQFVFLSVRRTLSWGKLSTIPSSTTRSVSNRSD